MDLDLASGWLQGAIHCPSPNYNARAGTPISLLVIHNISLPPGEFGTGCVQQFFQNTLDPSAHPYFASIQSLTVSAHFFIERTGLITQFVSCNDRAWHAGVSCFAGTENCNDFSIGIELEGTDDTPFTVLQYQALNLLIGLVQKAYPHITRERICGHSDIAPTRKTDPGPCFDWNQINVSRTVEWV